MKQSRTRTRRVADDDICGQVCGWSRIRLLPIVWPTAYMEMSSLNYEQTIRHARDIFCHSEINRFKVWIFFSGVDYYHKCALGSPNF